MKKVGIICGGFSSEYAISVKSATNIYESFPDEYEAYLIFLRKEGWFIRLGDNSEVVLDEKTFTYVNHGNTEKIDVAVIYIHGDPGENGKIQAYLDMIGMPYVNSGPLASQLSFDKWYCNQFLRGFDIEVAKSAYLTSSDQQWNEEDLINDLGLPLFVKPCDSGSSYGIARVDKADDLSSAIQGAFDEGETVVIESFLDGVEVTCGAYRGENGVVALPITEIVTENAFFDYEAKYEGSSQEITPARISKELTGKVQELTIRIYELLQLRSIARIDYMLVNNIPYVIEVNTIPGFSNESLIPQMVEAAGKTVKGMWSEILAGEL